MEERQGVFHYVKSTPYMTAEHGYIREGQRSACPRVLWGISSAGRAVALQAIGQRFDPVILHQKIGNIAIYDL